MDFSSSMVGERVCDISIYVPLAKMADLHASREEGGTVKTSLYLDSIVWVDMVSLQYSFSQGEADTKVP